VGLLEVKKVPGSKNIGQRLPIGFHGGPGVTDAASQIEAVKGSAAPAPDTRKKAVTQALDPIEGLELEEIKIVLLTKPHAGLKDF
jgi:hypothetical protein